AGVGYGGAAAATGSWAAYRDAVAAHGKYVVAVDGWRNPSRPPAVKLLHLLIVDPYHGNAMCDPLAVLAGLPLAAGRVRRDSPTVEVMHWLRRNVPKDRGFIYVQGGLTPFADYYLEGWQYESVGDRDIETLDPLGGRALYITDKASNDETAINFSRRRRRLWSLFLERYFDTSVRTVLGSGRLIGWHDEEGSAEATWRWMPERARMVLPPLGKPGELRLRLYAPLDAAPPPLITISAQGHVIDQFRPATSEFE